ncbi:pentapeptide repeat-containing protein [Bosea sp. (in: a-proteobacteria)]|uniref:pentapeptide repeat-containing protein n=1 Tax=Bosea sp. (in: a-proteobacteria) TaxID=1871050 RepID=UPI0025BD1626|nr:pentapeptide repeat-containing protein [Bosea sp. (in: a-proteobacteria)]
MADDVDIEALRAGDTDLVRRDFRGANLVGLELNGRDFTGSHLENANLSSSTLIGCDFREASLANLNASTSDLSGAQFSGSVFRVDFSNAVLRGAEFTRCLFSGCNFNNASLHGADFRNARIAEGTTFEGALVDEDTLFDGVQILRAISRQEAFRYYEVERGVLMRIEHREAAPPKTSVTADQADLISKVDALLAALRKLEPPAEGKPAAGMGHNNPPEETPIDRAEHSALAAALNDIKGEVTAPAPDQKKVKQAENVLVAMGTKILSWVGARATIAADEFAKGVGKYLSDPLRVSAAWTVFSSDLSALTHLVRIFFGL